MFIRTYLVLLGIFQYVFSHCSDKYDNNSNIVHNLSKNIFNFNMLESSQSFFQSSNFSDNNNKCNIDIRRVLSGVNNFELWALQMLDATGKLGSGILRGNIKSLGHYDECVETDAPDFTGQYCLSTLHMHSHNKQWNNLINTMTMGRINKETVESEDSPIPDLLPRLSHIHLGVCVPSSCTAQDVQMLLNSVLQNLTQNTPLEISAKIEHGNCYVNKSKPWTREDIYFISFISILMLLALIATACCILLPSYITGNKGIQILRLFSINENWRRLMNTESQGKLASLEGLRVLSIFLIILGHKGFFFMHEPWINKNILLKPVPMIKNMPFQNNSISVETFLMISGFLRAYILLRELQQNRHNFISSVWKRYLRLTPSAAVMIAFYATLAPRLGSGPNWYKVVVQPTTDACRTNWFYNLFYLNNYFHNDIHCLAQSWYLAADMQLFLVAPLLVYPIWRWPNKAKYILTSILIIATLIPFFYILQNSAIGTYLASASHTQLLQYFSYVYLPTHRRSAAYIVGMGLGFILFKMRDRKLKLSKKTVTTCWILYILIICAIVFGPYKLFQYDYVYNVWEMALYGALHRPIRAIAVAWVVFACHFGYGGWINDFLSAKIFQPLSKLSYCMFLTHYLVIMVNAGRIRTALYMDEYLFICITFGELVIALLASLFLHLIVEAPLLELAKFMLKKDSNDKYLQQNKNAKEK